MNNPTRFKIPRGDVILLLCFLAVGFSSLLVLSNMRSSDRMNFISAGCYSTAARDATVEEADDSASFQNALDSLQTPMILYRTGLDEESDLRGVLIYKNPALLPPLLEGRFFNEHDNYADIPTAVIGRDFEQQTFQKAGRRMIRIRETDYEVIGILGIPRVTRLDGLRMINMGAAEQQFGLNGSYKLDTETKRENSQARAELESALKGSMKLTVSPQKERKMPFYQVDLFGNGNLVERNRNEYARSDVTFYIYIIILLVFLLCALTTTVFWMQKQSGKAAIERMLGLYGGEIIRRRLRHYLPLCLAGSLLGMLGVLMLYWGGVLGVISVWDILVSICGTLLSGVLILLCVQWYFFKTDFAQELR